MSFSSLPGFSLFCKANKASQWLALGLNVLNSFIVSGLLAGQGRDSSLHNGTRTHTKHPSILNAPRKLIGRMNACYMQKRFLQGSLCIDPEGPYPSTKELWDGEEWGWWRATTMSPFRVLTIFQVWPNWQTHHKLVGCNTQDTSTGLTRKPLIGSTSDFTENLWRSATLFGGSQDNCCNERGAVASILLRIALASQLIVLMPYCRLRSMLLSQFYFHNSNLKSTSAQIVCLVLCLHPRRLENSFKTCNIVLKNWVLEWSSCSFCSLKCIFTSQSSSQLYIGIYPVRGRQEWPGKTHKA